MSDGRVLDITVKIGAGGARRELAALGTDMIALDRKAASLGAGVGAGITTGAGKAKGSLAGLKTQLAATGAAALTMAETHAAAMSRVGGAALGAGAVMTATAGLAMKAAVDWETAWAGVTKTVDGADLDGGKLEGQLRSLAKTLPFAHDEIGRVAEAAGQLGVAKNDIADFTKTALAMGVATNMTADEAATQFARFSNIMGISTKEVKHLGASVVDLGNHTATTESEIMAMSMRLGGMGRLVGMKAADVTAVAASMSSVGIEAEAGGTAISQFWRQMDVAVTRGNEKLGTMAKTAGMTSKEFAELWKKDPAKAFTAFEKGLGGMMKTGKGVNETLDALGVKQVRMSDALLRGAGAAQILAKNLDLSRKAYAAADKDNALLLEAQKRYETSASKMVIARNRIVDSMIDMGQAIAPAVADALSVLSRMVDGFTALPGPVKSAIGVLTAFGGVSLLAAGGVAKILPMVVELRKAMAALAAADFAGTMLSGVAGGFGGRLLAKGKTAGRLYAQGFMAPLKGIGHAAGEIGLTALGTKLGGKLSTGAGKAAGALARFGGAAKGAVTAAIPLAGTATAAAAGIAAAGYATQKTAVALQNLYSGSKLVSGELKDVEESFAAVQRGAAVSSTMFDDIKSNMFTSAAQMEYAVRNLANKNPLKFLETPSNDDINAQNRLVSILREMATLDVSQTSKAMKDLLSVRMDDLGISKLDAFKSMLDTVPELRQHYEELARSMKVPRDEATLLKIATEELKRGFDEAGNVIKLAEENLRDGRWGDIVPRTKEQKKALDELIQANYQAAAGFINLGEGADKGLQAWHDAMVRQGQAVQEWASNMHQMRGLVKIGEVPQDVLDTLMQMGPAGAAILQEVMQQWRSGSDAGLRMLEDGVAQSGQTAATLFAESFESTSLGQIMSNVTQLYGAQVAQAFGDAISDGSLNSIERIQGLMAQYPVKIPIEGDISGWEAQLSNLKIEGDGTEVPIRITGVDDEARAVLKDLGFAISKMDGSIDLRALPEGVKETLAGLGVQIKEVDGTIVLKGNSDEAKKVLADVLKQQYTATVNAKGETKDADKKLDDTAGKKRTAPIEAKANTAAAEKQLNTLARPRTTTVTVNTVNTGVKKAWGGYITGPGSGTSDSIPAWLSNGEYVIRAAAVKKYGVDMLHRINAQKYARGGYVGAARFGSDPRTWIENSLKPVTESLQKWASSLPGITPSPLETDSNKDVSIFSDVTLTLKNIEAKVESVGSDLKAQTVADSGYYADDTAWKQAESDARKAEEERRKAEEEKQARIAEALSDYKSLFTDVRGYGKEITEAFKTFEEIQKLLQPVAPEVDKKGKITAEAIAKADEKNRENFEKAIDLLTKLQEGLWNMTEGFANTWQVAGRERPPVDAQGKPVDWNVGNAVNRNSSREEVGNLLGFLTQAFTSLKDELGIVRETMRQPVSPMEVLKQLGVGDSWKQRDENGKIISQNTNVTNQKLENLKTEFHSLTQGVGDIKNVLLRPPAAVSKDGGMKRTDVPVSGNEDLRKLAAPQIKITPEVKVLNVDDITAHARVIVYTKLNYDSLQAQTEKAVASVKPPDIVVKARVDGSDLQWQTDAASRAVVPTPIVIPVVTGSSTME